MVEPITVGSLILGIISAYSTARTYLITRKNRKETKKRRQLKQLEQSVSVAPVDIQNEYDRDLSRLGSRFDAGDSIARGQLQDILIQLQSTMIQTLQGMIAGANVDIPPILSISDQSRLGSIAALAQQFQRLSVAAPVPRAITNRSISFAQSSLARASPDFCPGAIAFQKDDTKLLTRSDVWHCAHCKSFMSAWEGYVQDSLKWAPTLRGLHRAFSHGSHARHTSGPVLRYCRICWEKGGIISPKMRIDKWFTHMKTHIASGQFVLCRSKDGLQQRRAKCGNAACTKIHGGII